MRSQNGPQIMQVLLSELFHEDATWPSVFGTSATLPRFWGDSPPADPQQAMRLKLQPIRLVRYSLLFFFPYVIIIIICGTRTQASRVALCVDVRWVLMVGSIAGCRPSQATRYNFISMWLKHFYRLCVPRCLIYSDRLVTGLPSPKMCAGFLSPQVICTERKLIGRPSATVHDLEGNNSPTGLVEDLAVVEERYQLARWLKVDPLSIPTDAVSYTFPYKVWVPAVMEEAPDMAVSIMNNGNGEFLMCSKYGNHQEQDNTARSGGHLDGRLQEHVRPLCFFDRPGVLLFASEPAVILSYRHQDAVYVVRCSSGKEEPIHPAEMERMVARVGQALLVRAAAIQPNTAGLRKCTLRAPDDDTREGQVPVSVLLLDDDEEQQQQHPRDMDTMDDDAQRTTTRSGTKKPFQVDIQDVVRILRDGEEDL
jgi:hypothetical protein